MVAICHGRDKGPVSESLVNEGFKFTILGSTGGFLREGNCTFLIGCEESRLETLKDLISRNSKRREQTMSVAPIEGFAGSFVASSEKVQVGGGILFILNVEDVSTF